MECHGIWQLQHALSLVEFFVRRCSSSLSSFPTQDVTLLFTSMARPRRCLGTDLEIFMCVLALELMETSLDLLPSSALNMVKLFFWALSFSWPAWNHAAVAPNVVSALYFFRMSCSEFCDEFLVLQKRGELLLFLLEILAAIHGDLLRVSEMCMLSDTMCNPGTGVPRSFLCLLITAQSPRSFVCHETVWRVVHRQYVHHRLLFYHI